MSEREIRSVLREVCDELDRRARQLLLPAVIGAGLALAACGDGKQPIPPYGAPHVDARLDGGGDRAVYAAPLYAAPAADARRQEAAPPQPEYMAPGPDAK